MRRLAKDLEGFYRSDRGKALAREISHCLLVNWRDKDLKDQHLICFGYPPPGLKAVLKKGLSAAVFLPSFLGQKIFKLRKVNVSALGDENHLPFRPGSYDGALVFHALEYMQDQQSFIEEVWRVLGPGGRIFIMVPNKTGPWKKSGVAGEPRPFRYRDARQLLENNGFSIVDSYGILYGLPVGFIRKILFSGLLRTLSGGTLAGFPGFLIIEARKRTGPEKIKFKEPLRVVPGVRVNPEPTPE